MARNVPSWWRKRWKLLVALVLLGATTLIVSLSVLYTRKASSSSSNKAASSTSAPASTTTLAFEEYDRLDEGEEIPSIQSPSASSSSDLTFSSPSSKSLPTAASKMDDLKALDKKEGGAGGGGGTCWADDIHQLTEAIENVACSMIMVTNPEEDAYAMTSEFLITRQVTIQGNSLMVPFIDCGNAVRCFRVMPGGFLELRYVRLSQGEGIIRPRFPNGNSVPPEAPMQIADESDYVREQRGGMVLILPGALGGTFVGVIFDNDDTGAEEVLETIDLILSTASYRVYGGAVAVAGGEATFIGCNFWDHEIITPIDVLYIGGTVLVLAGQATFIGCSWLFSTVMGFENGAGFANGILGGIATYTFCQFNEIAGFIAMNGIGETFFVGGGVQVVTGAAFNYFNVGLFFSGAGEVSVAAGVQIVTGASLFDAAGLLAVFGAGFNYIVGAGLFVHTGAALHQYSGPLITALAGGYSFVGSGTFISTGSPCIGASSVSFGTGLSFFHFVGSGLGVFIDSPCASYGAVSSEDMLGQYIALGAGLLVWIGGPLIGFAAIDEYFGIGASIWVGAGAAVLGYTPLIQYVAIQRDVRDIWVQGTCEPSDGNWATGKPFFVTGGGECIQTGEQQRGGREVESEASTSSIIHQTISLDGSASKDDKISDALQSRPKVGLLAFNVSKNSMNLKDQEMMQSVASIVPPSFIRAAEIMERNLAAIRRDREKDQSLSIHIDSQTDDYCGICGVERLTLSGNGSDNCDQSSSCQDKDFNPPPETESLFSWETVDFKGHFLVLADLESTTASGLGSTESFLKPADLQDALKSAISTNGGGSVEDSILGLQVTIWKASVDELFADMFPPPTPSRYLTEEYDVMHRFKVAFMTTDKFNFDLIVDALRHGDSDPETAAADEIGYQENDLEARMKSYLSSQKGTGVGHLGLFYDRFIHVPAYNTELLSTKNPVTSLGAYSIVLSDPSQPAVPLVHAEYMKNYQIILEKFTPKSRIILSLMGRPEKPVDKEGGHVKQIGTVATDENGNANINYRFNLFDASPGDYYLQIGK